jgi:hypothetical protein
MTHIRNLATGAVSYVPAHGLTVAGQVVSRTTSAAALDALGWEWYEPPVVETPAPTEYEQIAAQAAALWALPDVPEAVAAVLARVQAVAALGVDISDWSFQGVTAAAEAAMGTGDKLAILTASVALRTAWDRLVYHAGDMRTADRLWPYLYDIALKL